MTKTFAVTQIFIVSVFLGLLFSKPVFADACTSAPVTARGEESRFIWLARTKTRANWRAKVRSIPALGPDYANWARAQDTEERCLTGPAGTVCASSRARPAGRRCARNSSGLATIFLSRRPRNIRSLPSNDEKALARAVSCERGDGRDARIAGSHWLPGCFRLFARAPLRSRLPVSLALVRISHGSRGHHSGRDVEACHGNRKLPSGSRIHHVAAQDRLHDSDRLSPP